MFSRKNVFFPKDNFDTFLRFHSNSWGGKVDHGFTTLGKVFFDVKFFLEVVSPISKKIFICKNMMTIINRKMDFLDEKLHFSFQKVKSTLQMVNTYAFHPLFSVFFL